MNWDSAFGWKNDLVNRVKLFSRFVFTDNVLMQNSVGGTLKHCWDEPQNIVETNPNNNVIAQCNGSIFRTGRLFPAFAVSVMRN